MSGQANDISNIMDFLMKKDVDWEPNVGMKMETLDMGYDASVAEHFLEDAWPSSPDELLDNIFSLEGGDLLQGSAASDSGLSMDHSDFDMLELSPLLDGGLPSPLSSLGPSPAPVSPAPASPVPISSPPPPQPPATVPATSPAITDIQPTQPSAVISPQLIHTADVSPLNFKKRAPIKVQATLQQSGGVGTPRKVLRVAPMLGNPRSILLPVTIKDMKELKTIKIINASDLKNSASIKIAAANFLQQSKQAAHKGQRLVCTPQRMPTYTQTYQMSHHTHQEESGRSESSEQEEGEGGESGQEESIGSAEEEEDVKQFPRVRLTAEERRLLQREGVSLPARYPLTRAEERELKRIRRKIRNKISAQDSRRRKKEYVDGLEDRVKQCTEENQTLMKRIKALQSQNHSLTTQLRRLQTMVSSGKMSLKGGNVGSVGTAPPATCLLVLLLSLALVVAPSLRPSAPPSLHTGSPHTQLLSSIRRALLSAHTPIHQHHLTTPATAGLVLDDTDADGDDMILGDHTYPLPTVGKGSPSSIYMDMPLDLDGGEPPLKLEKMDYDSDYGGKYSSRPPHIQANKNHTHIGTQILLNASSVR